MPIRSASLRKQPADRDLSRQLGIEIFAGVARARAGEIRIRGALDVASGNGRRRSDRGGPLPAVGPLARRFVRSRRGLEATQMGSARRREPHRLRGPLVRRLDRREPRRRQVRSRTSKSLLREVADRRTSIATATLKDDIAGVAAKDAAGTRSGIGRIKAFYIMGSGPGQGFAPDSSKSISVPFVVDTARIRRDPGARCRTRPTSPGRSRAHGGGASGRALRLRARVPLAGRPHPQISKESAAPQASELSSRIKTLSPELRWAVVVISLSLRCRMACFAPATG